MGEGLKRAVKAIKENQAKLRRPYNYRAKIAKKALYFYICERCGKKRNSRIYDRALGKVCQVCLRNQVPDNQQSLFGTYQPIGELKEGHCVDSGELISRQEITEEDAMAEAIHEGSKIDAGDIDEAGDAEGIE